MELELIGSAEAARRLGVTRSKLQRLVNAGRIQPMQKGEGLRGAMIFDASVIDRYARSRESGGAEHTAKRAVIRGVYDGAGVPLSDDAADSLAYRTLSPAPTRRDGSTDSEAAV